MTTLPDDHTDWSAVGAYQDQFTGILCKSGAGARFKRARRAGVIYARPARKGALYRGSGGGLLLCEEVGDEVFDLASKVSSIFGLRHAPPFAWAILRLNLLPQRLHRIRLPCRVHESEPGQPAPRLG